MDALRSPRFGLFADACLLTAGAFALCTAIGGGIMQLLFRVGGDGVPEVVQGVLGLLFTFAPLVAGPLAAWRLRGRRVTGRAVLGSFLGAAAAFAVVGAAVAAILVVARPLRAELPAIVTLAAVLGVALLAVVSISLASAVRDLRGRGERRTLDLARLTAGVAIGLFCAAIAGIAAFDAGSEIIEALPFLLLSALVGGMTAAGANLLTGPGPSAGTRDAASA